MRILAGICSSGWLHERVDIFIELLFRAIDRLADTSSGEEEVVAAAALVTQVRNGNMLYKCRFSADEKNWTGSIAVRRSRSKFRRRKRCDPRAHRSEQAPHGLCGEVAAGRVCA